MFFKEQFKDKILSGTKCYTIRNTKRVNQGTIFKIRLGTRFKSEYLGNARCLSVEKYFGYELGSDFASELIFPNKKAIYLKDLNNNYVSINVERLGFSSVEEARNFYRKTLKGSSFWLHYFKLECLC